MLQATADTSSKFVADFNSNTTSELLQLLNEHLAARGQKTIARWSQSKAKLIERLHKVLEEAALGTSEAAAPPVAEEPYLGCESEDPFDPQKQVGEPDDEDEAAEKNDPADTVQFLEHDAAIRFIRRFRRRRDIFIKGSSHVVPTSTHADVHHATCWVKVSAKQARAYVTQLIGPVGDTNFRIRLAIEPLDVPPGSRHKGTLHVG